MSTGKAKLQLKCVTYCFKSGYWKIMLENDFIVSPKDLKKNEGN